MEGLVWKMLIYVEIFCLTSFNCPMKVIP